MNKYYNIKAKHVDSAEEEIMFGSFDREDCVYEMDAERDSWKEEGYRKIRIVSVNTTDNPDPKVYK